MYSKPADGDHVDSGRASKLRPRKQSDCSGACGGAMIIRILLALTLFLSASSNATRAAQAPSSIASMRFLYPSLSGTFAAAWIAKEAGYFAAESLDVELIRVGGSTRIVASMVGGSAPIIHAGASASMAATVAGSDAVIIGRMSTKSPFHLIARPEIKQPSDLKGKRAGISAFGATSDFLVRLALQRFGLEPGKDVAHPCPPAASRKLSPHCSPAACRLPPWPIPPISTQ